VTLTVAARRARPLRGPAEQAQYRETLGGAGKVRVLVVEDVATVAAMIESALRTAGMEVVCVPTSAAALASRAVFRPDMVLLDLSLPDGDGLNLVVPFVAAGCGVIVVTASGAESERVAALDLGADDYIVKPVMLHELAARIRAVHRRLDGRTVQGDRSARIGVDPTLRQLVGPDGGRTDLTEAEQLLLEALLDAAGLPVSREWLSRVALRRPVHTDDRSVDQLVLKLRRKLAALGCPERTILSVRRQGYVISDPGLFQRPGP
jgi:DNA-binding response OmpR family regulator